MSIFLRRSYLIVGMAVVMLGVLAVACGDDDDDDGGGNGDGDTAGTTVDATLSEFVIEADPASVPAGEVTFKAANEGSEEHEMVIAKTNLAPDKLPTKDDGSADEEGAGVDAIDEIAEFAAGATEELTVTLEPGKYVLFCNIVTEDAGKTESHYEEGMHAAFTVQ